MSDDQVTSWFCPNHLRAATTARRLLSGVGRSSFVAYRDAPQESVPLLAHGLSEDGALIVALRDDDYAGIRRDAQIRLDIVREAWEGAASVIVASVHLLGTLSPLSATDPLPRLDGTLALAAEGAGVVLAQVHTDVVILHDGAGAHRMCLDHARQAGLPARFTGAVDLMGAHEIFDRLSQFDRHELCAAVEQGCVDGSVLSRRALGRVTTSLRGNVTLLDVDAVGITLLRTGDETMDVLHVPFRRNVFGPQEFEAALRQLLPTDSALTRSSRH